MWPCRGPTLQQTQAHPPNHPRRRHSRRLAHSRSITGRSTRRPIESPSEWARRPWDGRKRHAVTDPATTARGDVGSRQSAAVNCAAAPSSSASTDRHKTPTPTAIYRRESQWSTPPPLGTLAEGGEHGREWRDELEIDRPPRRVGPWRASCRLSAGHLQRPQHERTLSTRISGKADRHQPDRRSTGVPTICVHRLLVLRWARAVRQTKRWAGRAPSRHP